MEINLDMGSSVVYSVVDMLFVKCFNGVFVS